MKIEVDLKDCISSGMCTAAAPDIFELDETSNLVVLEHGELEGELLDQAVEAVDVCPVQAIRLVGDS